jgi:hypothetical protein
LKNSRWTYGAEQKENTYQKVVLSLLQ